MEKTLTKQQQAEIYCIKNGHANYIWKCWGYVHCGRCGKQIGDQLAGCFDTGKLLVIGCNEKNCKVCDPIIKKLSPLDKKIFKKINSAFKGKGSLDYNKILEDIEFGG